MRRLIQSAALAAGLLGSAPAFAADLYAPPPEAAVTPAPVWSWTGFYLGIQGGYAWGRSHVGYTPEEDLNGWDVDPQGLFGGVHAGIDYQFNGGLVLGLAADINGGNVISSTSPFFDSGGSLPPGEYDGTMSLDWFGTVRVKAGFAMDRWMPFVTAGAAYGGYTFIISDSFNPSGLSGHSGQVWGWTAGAGISYAVTHSLILTAEYRYIDFGTFPFSTTEILVGYGGDGPFVGNLKTQNVTLGLSLKF